MAPAQRAFTEALQHHQARRLKEARAGYERALRLRPDYAEAHNNLGSLLGDLGDQEAALVQFTAALALRPDYAMAWLGRGTAHWARHEPEAAMAAYRAAIAAQPDFFPAHNFLALLLGEEGRFTEGLASAKAALHLQPHHPEAHNTQGNLLRGAGQLEAAIASYRQAIALQPAYADAHFNLGQALLAAGRFAEGWREYEWRWATEQMANARPRFAARLWRGEAGRGERLLLHAEQGFGDMLQFCRYAPLAAAQGYEILLEVPAPLVRLMGSLEGVSAVIPRGAARPEFDLHCPMMSLPLCLRTRLESVPGSLPYLQAPAEAAAHWEARLAARGEGLRVGFAWAGNPSPERPARAAMDRRRSIDPAFLAPLAALPGLLSVSLQRGGPAFPEEAALFDAMEEMEDFADTAALVSRLDLVVTVDTAVAHLAGALGRPVWLLDRSDPCWRWMSGRDDSPWYPGLRIFRQTAPGDWPGVIARLRAALEEAAGRPCLAAQG